MRHSILAGLAAAIVGCEAGAGFESVVTSDAQAVVTVAGDELDFGPVHSGHARFAEVLLRNDGGAALEVEQVVVPAGGVFVWANEDRADTRLAPGEATVLLVGFAPAAPGRIEDELLLVTNDPAGLLSVPVRAEGLASGLALLPNDLELPPAQVNDVVLVDLLLHNEAPDAVDVSLELDLQSGEPGSLQLLFPPDWVPAGDSVAVQLAWTPREPGEVWARVRTTTAGGPVVSAGVHGVVTDP